jgi:hypothetical protein
MEMLSFEDRIRRMIMEHKAMTGRDPQVINIPHPDLSVDGIKVSFHTGRHWVTADVEKCVHHEFKEYEKPPGMGFFQPKL